MENFILKIGKDTNHVRAAKSIETQVLQGNRVFVDVIGTAANYTATKAFIQAKVKLSVSGIHVAYSPSFENLKTSAAEVKTAIRWEVLITNK